MSKNHGASPIRLGVLDNWDQVSESIALAEEADRMGFHRYWLTEHPPQPNPQLFAALVAGVTERIRVGTAGILLNFHTPLQAAQQFLLLEQVYPGRIDAGFCAGGASSQELASALFDGRPDLRLTPEAFVERADALIGFLRGNLPSDHPYGAIEAWPGSLDVPEVWSFGTGARSAAIAARQGTAFGYSLFHHSTSDDTTTVNAYRDDFQPSAHLAQPLVGLAVAGVCAETECEARRLASQHVNTFILPTIIGSPGQCHEQLATLAERYQTPELVLLDVSPDFDSRLRSYRLLAEELGLCEPEASATDTITYRDFHMACTD
jgi:luciferase family oxidoreductase group 1